MTRTGPIVFKTSYEMRFDRDDTSEYCKRRDTTRPLCSTAVGVTRSTLISSIRSLLTSHESDNGGRGLK